MRGRLHLWPKKDNCDLVGKRSAGHRKGWPVVTICPSSSAGAGKGPGGLCETNPAFVLVLEEGVLVISRPPPPRDGRGEGKKEIELTL